MKKKLTHNLGLKLTSLVLACVLWFLVAEIGDPKDTKYFNNIPVRLVNTELLTDENKVYEVLDNTDTVRVAVYAPRSVTDNLRSSDIYAEADIRKLTDINTIAITYNIANADVNITGDHEVVRLNVEDRTSKWIRLNYDIIGEAAEGYVVTSAVPDQTQIEISGPKSIIDRVSYAYLGMDVSGATTDMSANVDFSLFDKNNIKVDQSRITKNVDYVHMSVEVFAAKEVPVEINTMGEPAEGYLLTGEEKLSFSKIRLAGSAVALSNINKLIIPAEDLDITGVQEDYVKTLDVKNYLPESIKLVDSTLNSKLTVTIFVEPMVEKEFEVSAENIVISNLPEELQGKLSSQESVYKITVSGLAKDVNAVQSEFVRGRINVGEWMEEKGVTELKPGSYDLPIEFFVGDGITVMQQVNARIMVEKME